MALKDIAVRFSVAGADAAAGEIEKVGKATKSATDLMYAAWEKMSGAVQAAASAIAAFKVGQYGAEATMFAANVEQANRALSVIANTMGITSREAIKYRDSLRDINITTNSATNATAQFIKAGFPLSALNKLGTAAQGAAISYGMMTGEMISSSQALDKMIRSLVTGNVTELHTLGINVMVRDVLKENSKVTGEAAMAVDSHHRKLLMLNDVLSKTEPLMHLYSASIDLAAKQISSSKRPIEELKLALGNLFLPELTVMAAAFYQMVSGGMKFVKAYSDELNIAKSVIKDLAQGLIYSTGFLAAYTAAMVMATAATVGFSGIGSLFVNTMATMRTGLSLTGAAATVTATTVGVMGESIVASTSVATMSVMSLKAAFGVLSAFLVGWEIGTVLSNKFEVVRKAGVYMVHGLIKTWDYASEAYERFVATVNPFGDEEKQQTQLAAITSKYEAIKKTRDEALSGSLANTNITGVATPKSYVDNMDWIKDGIRKQKELEEKARLEREEANRVNTVTDFAKMKAADDGRRALNESFWAWEDAGHKLSAKTAIEALQWKNEQGLIVARDFIDQKEALEKGVIDREIQRNNNRIVEMQASDTIMGGAGASRYSDQTIKFEAAQKQLNEALTKGLELTAQSNGLDTDAQILREKDILQIEAKARALTAELAAMQATNDAMTASMVGTNAIGEFDSISDQTANQLAVQKAAHEERLRLIQIERDANTFAMMNNVKSYTEYVAKVKKLDDQISLEKQKNSQSTTKITQQGFTSQIAMIGNYAAIGSQLFSGLADAQDQSSRAGFESAKAYSLGAAVMSTAAAIIGQLTGPDAWTPKAWARSVVAGLLGAIQIAKIASTSFGGGATGGFATPSGSFGGGGSGGGTGIGNLSTPMSSIQDSQTNESFDRLIASTDNVAVEIGRLSKNMESLTALFEKGGAGFNLATNAPGQGTNLKGATGLGTLGLVHQLGTAGLKALFEPWRFGEMMQDMGRALFGGSWGAVGAGISLSIKNGMVDVLNYVDMHKDGGLFSSDKNRTDYSANSEASRYMAGLIDPYIDELTRMARTLGTNFDTNAYSSTPANIATAGRKPEDIAKDLEAWMLKQLQGMALTIDGLQGVVGAYDDAYAKLKLYNDALVSTNDALSLIGKAQLQGSLKTGEWLSNMQESLFGGMKEFTEAVDTYFTSMFDDSQQSAMKAAQAQQQVNRVFNEMGATVPATKAEFIQLVNGLNIMTESGAKTFHALMGVSEAFATVQDHAKEVQKAMDDLITDGLTYSVDLLTKAMDTTAANLRAALDVAKSATSQLIALRGGNLSPQQNYHELKTAFTTAVASNDSATILRIASQYAAASKAYNASGTNYQSDYAQIEQALAGLTGMPDTADLSLEALNAHTTYLDSINKTITAQSGLMSTNNGELASLNGLMAQFVGNQEELKRANQAAFDARVGSASSALSAINNAASVSSLAGVISSMASGATSNPFEFDQTMATMAKNVAEGKSGFTQDMLTNAMNSKINPYFSDYMKAGVVGTIPTVKSPTLNYTDPEMDEKVNALFYAIKTGSPMVGANIVNVNPGWDDPNWEEYRRVQPLVDEVLAKIITNSTVRYAIEGEYLNARIANSNNGTGLTPLQTWNSILSAHASELNPYLAAYYDANNVVAKYRQSFAVGTPYVPYDMPANIHQGEIIMDRASSDVLRKYGIPQNSNSELIGEIRALKAEVSELKKYAANTENHTAANVRVSQAGFNAVIEQSIETNKNTKDIGYAARLARAT